MRWVPCEAPHSSQHQIARTKHATPPGTHGHWADHRTPCGVRHTARAGVAWGPARAGVAWGRRFAGNGPNPMFPLPYHTPHLPLPPPPPLTHPTPTSYHPHRTPAHHITPHHHPMVQNDVEVAKVAAYPGGIARGRARMHGEAAHGDYGRGPPPVGVVGVSVMRAIGVVVGSDELVGERELTRPAAIPQNTV